jgi:hypothetical protein
MPDAVSSDMLPNTSTKYTVTGRTILQRSFYNTGVLSFSWNRRLDIEVHEITTDASVEDRRSHKIEEIIRNSSSVQIYGDDPATGASGVLIAYGVVESGNIALHDGWPVRFTAQINVRLYPELPSS